MIVDLLRNDLARVLHSIGGGRVAPYSLFDVETYETLLQMTSSIAAIPARPQCAPLEKLLRPLFPCGSVTGAPKIRAMQIIHELEKEPRGVYCGAIGYSGPAITEFNVPIRTLAIRDDRGGMGIGSGIVHDSDPESEWRECLLKAKFLENPVTDFQLIETLLLRPTHGYWLQEYHLERLSRSARYFLFEFNEEEAREALRREQRARDRAKGASRVRLLLHRDGRLETSATALDPETTAPADPLTPMLITPAPKTIFSAIRTDPSEAHLFHKTTQRRLYDTQRLKFTAQGYYEVFFINTRGEVTEGSISNIFIEKNGEILTPPLSCGLLAGTFRRLLLERGKAREQILSVQDVLAAEAVYAGNSVRGLVRVGRPDHH